MKQKRVFWILAGNKNTGSSRIHGFNIHEALIKKGIKSKILHSNSSLLTLKQKLWIILKLKKGDLLVLQKRKEISLKKIFPILKVKGVEIAFVDCDIPICDDSLINYFDYIICASNRLAMLYKSKFSKKNVMYIPDAVECFIRKDKVFDKKAIYFGWLTKERIQRIELLKRLFEENDWKVLTMSNKKEADIQWFNWRDKETFNIISEYGVSVIPVDDDEASTYKSINRVVQSLAVGNIVLCDDIEAYREVINNGKNGFLCSKPEQWTKALEVILNKNERDAIIEKGFDTAKEYSLDKIILDWVSFLELE